MFVVPAMLPVITPEASIDAVPGVSEVHKPPGDAFVHVIIWPSHTDPGPVRLAGRGFTFTACVRTQPVGSVYEIVTAPCAMPLTRPEALTVARPLLLLLHVPPASGLPSSVVCPMHTWKIPVITPGNGSTVAIIVCRQPVVAFMYVIWAIPAPIPVNTPVGDISAMPVLPELHTPPGVKSYRFVVWP